MKQIAWFIEWFTKCWILLHGLPARKAQRHNGNIKHVSDEMYTKCPIHFSDKRHSFVNFEKKLLFISRID